MNEEHLILLEVNPDDRSTYSFWSKSVEVPYRASSGGGLPSALKVCGYQNLLAPVGATSNNCPQATHTAATCVTGRAGSLRFGGTHITLLVLACSLVMGTKLLIG